MKLTYILILWVRMVFTLMYAELHKYVKAIISLATITAAPQTENKELCCLLLCFQLCQCSSACCSIIQIRCISQPFLILQVLRDDIVFDLWVICYVLISEFSKCFLKDWTQMMETVENSKSGKRITMVWLTELEKNCVFSVIKLCLLNGITKLNVRMSKKITCAENNQFFHKICCKFKCSSCKCQRQ